MAEQRAHKTIARNRSARHAYFIDETFEALAHVEFVMNRGTVIKG